MTAMQAVEQHIESAAVDTFTAPIIHQHLKKYSVSAIGNALWRLWKANKLHRLGTGVYGTTNSKAPAAVGLPAPVLTPKKTIEFSDEIASIDQLIDHCEKLAKEVIHLRTENADMKRCIDAWGARIRQAKIIPLISGLKLEECGLDS